MGECLTGRMGEDCTSPLGISHPRREKRGVCILSVIKVGHKLLSLFHCKILETSKEYSINTSQTLTKGQCVAKQRQMTRCLPSRSTLTTWEIGNINSNKQITS